MDKKQNNMSKISEAEKNIEDDTSSKNKQRNRGKKRKRVASDSSTDIEDVLPENTLEIEKNLHASAVKNNLDDASVKKILKKVVTNDHVLALVKLREEEEESSTEEGKHVPKLTRAKVKELKKVSTGNTAWNLENLELTPIKHIPVKTRPEVKALIAQELPEDEDDDEYEPEDVPSDDDQTMESCSDLDSLPRTPATPKLTRSSPKIVKDGPFKVPPEITSTAKRKLELDNEEATIALRTRSKLSLSETPIEHIESSFVPPDELPVPAVDDLWNEFLVGCLNPAPSNKHEDDDETDPEYNAAADPDAPDDEDEEALEKSIVKISKKELNDLMTELFSIIPEVGGTGEGCVAENVSDSALEAPTETTPTEVSGQWEGKKEPLSDDENTPRKKISDRIIFERRSSSTRFSIGKNEPEDMPECQENTELTETVEETATTTSATTAVVNNSVVLAPQTILIKPLNMVNIALEEKVVYVEPPPAIEPLPPSLLYQFKTQKKEQQQMNHRVELHISEGPCILPEQMLILQQQLRQHIQLATCNFLQLYVHPIHWTLAPTYKEFLETLTKMSKSRPDSVVKVCNLQPAMELVLSWEKSLSKNTPENSEYVQFVQRDADRGRRCSVNNNFYVGNFHNTFMHVVANSPVFIYPYLLPPLPYRSDGVRRQSYLRPEDELIALGLDQFWSYVENNPKLFPPPVKPHPRYRWGLNATVELVAKYMFPFLNWRTLHTHIQHIRRRDKENPISIFLTSREIKPIQHKILPFNPKKTLHDHSEEEIPYIWLRYLAKTSKLRRFKNHMSRRSGVLGQAPAGVALNVAVSETKKAPLPAHFTTKFVTKRASQKSQPEPTNTNQPTDLSPIMATNIFTLEQTSNGPCLVPLTVTTKTFNSVTDNIAKTTDSVITDTTNTVNCTQTPISSTKTSVTPFLTIQPIAQKSSNEIIHCKCCVLLQRIRKSCHRQSHITDYFSNVKRKKFCYCNEIKFPRITNRLRLLVAMHKDPWLYGMETLNSRLMKAEKEAKLDVLQKNRVKLKEAPLKEDTSIGLNDLVFVITFRSKLAAKNTCNIMRKINSLFVNFDLDTGDPAYLAVALYNICKDDQIGLFHDFIGFLTAEQAARCGKFTNYFIQTCLVDLVNKIESEISENERREATLRQLSKSITYGTPTACDICTALLPTLTKYPDLALHVFSLFPHMTTKDNDRNVNNVISVKTTNNDDKQNVQEDDVMLVEEQNEIHVEQRNEVQIENKNKEQANKQTKTQVEKQRKMLKQTRPQVKKQKTAELEEQNEELEEQNGEALEDQSEEELEEQSYGRMVQLNEEQVENISKVQTRKQAKAQIEKQKRMLKLTRPQSQKQNKAKMEEQNEKETEEHYEEEQNLEKIEQQYGKQVQNKNKSPAKKPTKATIENKKQVRVQLKKQNKAQTEEQNQEYNEEQEGQHNEERTEQRDEDMEQQDEEEMEHHNNEPVKHHNKEQDEQHNEERTEQQDKEIEQQNKKQVKQQNKEQVEQLSEKLTKQQHEEEMEQHNNEQVTQQKEKQMETHNEKQMNVENEIQMEVQNNKQIEVEKAKQIVVKKEHQMAMENEQIELQKEDKVKPKNDKQVEHQNEEQVKEQKRDQMKFQYPERIEETVNETLQTTVDYEADHSSSGEDENDSASIHERDTEETDSKENESEPAATTELDTPMVTIIKTENQDYSDNSDDSMVIASDEESTVSEGPAWSRDEDKIILESLKNHLTPEERMDKTILEILEEEHVFQTLTDTLSHKLLKDIKDRVVYLLKMLLLSEK